MLKNLLLAATVTVVGCADAPTEVGSASMVTKSTASFGDVGITGGFSLTLVTEIRGTELSVVVNDDLTMMTICSIPADIRYAGLHLWDETISRLDLNFAGTTVGDGGCISWTAPLGGTTNSGFEFALPFFEPGAYLLDLRPARSGITVDRVTFLLPNAAPPSLSDLADEVDLLLERGALNQGQANALHATLNAATRQRDAGKNVAAIGSLGAFINQLQALEHAGKLSATEAQELIDIAQALIDELNA